MDSGRRCNRGYGAVPVVKAKVGPQIMVLIADNQIYDQIPVKKEVKKDYNKAKDEVKKQLD